VRAILCHELAGPGALVLGEREPPRPGACQIRIRVGAAGVNFADALMVRGRYQERPPLPFVPGLELAGTVDACGAAVDGLEPGRPVMAMVDHGAFAEYAIARIDDVVPLPEGVDLRLAAGLPIAWGTAYGALVWRAGLSAGETLLVHGASGGTGLAAVACGRALGARVIATARGGGVREQILARGAAEVLDSEAPDLVERIRELTGGQGVDVAFDPVGGAMFEVCRRTVAWEGRILIIGFASGRIPQIPANHLLVKNAAAIGFYWGSYRGRDPERLRAGFRVLLDWLQRGVVHPPAPEVVPFERTAEAVARLEERRAGGKLVIAVDPALATATSG